MLRGDVTPVFFGSAVTNFGVELFLDAFVKMGPPPAAHVDAEQHRIEPTDERFSGFVFKIQANMDPRHRDRIAFVRVCSGKFERDMTVRNVRTGKDVRLTRAMKLFASDRESVDVAFARDVVGLANPGVFAIGDTLADGAGVRFEPIPAFEPEHFSLVRSTDTATYKSFQKGIAQLREEGAIQVFYPYGQTRIEPILAAVGALQFEVVKYRLESEYNVKTVFQTLPYAAARRNQIIILAVFVIVLVLLVRACSGHENKYENIARELTQSIQANDYNAVAKLENTETAAEMGRGRLGAAADTLSRLGRVKSVKENTPAGDGERVHEFEVTFDNGTVHEKILFDPQDKVFKFAYDHVTRKK